MLRGLVKALCLLVDGETYMGKNLIITEKPSVAREFAKALNQNMKSKDGYIESVTVMDKSQRHELFADYFIDATGDANLSYMCGCPFKLGREKDGLCQPMTLCFRMVNVDTDNMNRADINELYKEKKEKGEKNYHLQFIQIVVGKANVRQIALFLCEFNFLEWGR